MFQTITRVTATWARDCSLKNTNGTTDRLGPKGRKSIHTVKENAEALVVATKEIGLEVNAD